MKTRKHGSAESRLCGLLYIDGTESEDGQKIIFPKYLKFCNLIKLIKIYIFGNIFN